MRNAKAVLLLIAVVLVGALELEHRTPALRAAGSNHNVTLTWTASTSAATYPTLGYNIYRGNAAGAESATPLNSAPVDVGCSGASCTYIDNNVTPSSKYYYEVAACVSGVCSAMSNEASATVPFVSGDISAPTGLSSTVQ